MKVFGFSFDLDTVAMGEAGVSDSDRTRMYLYEIPLILTEVGFQKYVQGSMYCSGVYSDEKKAIAALLEELDRKNPSFRRWVKSCEIFVLESWSNITAQVRYGSIKETEPKRNQQISKGSSRKVISQKKEKKNPKSTKSL